jgi:hypothetical protein
MPNTECLAEICESIAEAGRVTSSRQNLLKLLRAELEFLNRQGYHRSERSPWRSAYIFEESPSCPNYGNPSRPHACKDCWLMQFVSSDLEEEQIPCRFVQLTPDGITVDALYRYGTGSETEEALRNWLQERIHEIEKELSEHDRLLCPAGIQTGT